MKGAVLRVLTYHRVMHPAGGLAADPSLISATPHAFERQMRYLARRYRPISAEEAIEAARRGGALPERAVLVTFDDAYRDFGEIAWPIMRRNRVPATVFVPTAYPDRPDREFWWDRLHRAFSSCALTELVVGEGEPLPLRTPEARRQSLRALQRYLKSIPHAEAMPLVEEICRRLGNFAPLPADVLGWDALRSLAADGVALGGHTHTHPALNRIPREQLHAEIHGSRELLEREVGAALPIFAYPFGAHDDQSVSVVEEAGYQLALTCRDGHNRLGSTHPLRLHRTNVTRKTSPALLRLRLLPLFARVDRWRHRAEAA